MACTFDKNTVSKEELEEMQTKLRFISEKTNQYTTNPYSKNKKKVPTINMYFVHKNTVTFPLLTWSAFFGEIPNTKRVYSETKINFTRKSSICSRRMFGPINYLWNKYCRIISWFW
jgi:hypothetical protein